MQSPLPAPSPAPSPPPSLASDASLFQLPSSNGFHGHVTLLGSAGAWPLIESNEALDEAAGLESRAGGAHAVDDPRDGSCGSVNLNALKLPNPDALFSASLHSINNSTGILHPEHLQTTMATFPPAAFSAIDDADQNQFSAGENGFVDRSLPPTFVNNNLNLPGTVNNLGFGIPIPSVWSPPQIPADQSFMSYNNPYLMSPQTMSPSPFPIQRTPCPLCPQTFTRPSDLTRHYTSVHLGIKHHCFYPGCDNNRGNGYCCAEKLRTHQRERHGVAWF
ncbi:hypothetical protein V8E51_015995 [Hyaloscypha variabilis]